MEPALLHLVVFYKILIRTMPNANGRCHAAMHIFISLMRRDSRNNERNGISLEQTLQQLQDEHRKRTDQANTLTSSAIRFELRYSTEKKEIADQLAALMSDLTAIEEEVVPVLIMIALAFDLSTIAGFLDAKLLAE